MDGDAPFYYLRAEDEELRSAGAEDLVPRDAVYVLVGGSVKVVAPRAFQRYKYLLRVDLQEGVREIGLGAFANCPNLVRVSWPSSLVGIGDWAFSWCPRLSGVILREGLRKIGARAFSCCALEKITVPSSVVEIGSYAFADCDNLEAATLAGGTVTLARGAFHSPRLERVGIASLAVVVEAGEDGVGGVAAVTRGIVRDPVSESPWLILASPHLATMRPEELADLTGAIDGVADAARGAGPSEFSVEEVSGRIRDCFADRLSTWYRRYKREVATVLELGLWKIELGRAAGRETKVADAPTRDASRLTCGADPIVGLVLSSLAGPHRPADRSENEGSIGPSREEDVPLST